MDRDILQKKYDELVAKLGSAGGFVPAVANSIKVPLKAGDIEGLRARATEGKEFAAAFDALCDEILADTADGDLSVLEAAGLANALVGVVDEAEDVATGVDEDDPVPV